MCNSGYYFQLFFSFLGFDLFMTSGGAWPPQAVVPKIVGVARDPTDFSTLKLDPITKSTDSDVGMACSRMVMSPLHQLATCPASTSETPTETLVLVKRVLRGIVIIE